MTFSYVIGIDEVGRGPLAGPVTVCGFALPFHLYKNDYRQLKKVAGQKDFDLFKDSKKLKPMAREISNAKIRQICRQYKDGEIVFAISTRSSTHIDAFGISKSIQACISSILLKLKNTLHLDSHEILVLLDGSLKAPHAFINQKTIIKGDAKEKVISCASILAKVHRDKYMSKLAKKDSAHAKYNFEIHKGYGTLAHRKAILKHGLSSIHRRSFCRNFLA